jgi:hypothetical protein
MPAAGVVLLLRWRGGWFWRAIPNRFPARPPVKGDLAGASAIKHLSRPTIQALLLVVAYLLAGAGARGRGRAATGTRAWMPALSGLAVVLASSGLPAERWRVLRERAHRSFSCNALAFLPAGGSRRRAAAGPVRTERARRSGVRSVCPRSRLTRSQGGWLSSSDAWPGRSSSGDGGRRRTGCG